MSERLTAEREADIRAQGVGVAQVKDLLAEIDALREERDALLNRPSGLAAASARFRAVERERDEARAKVEAYKRGQGFVNAMAREMFCKQHSEPSAEGDIADTACPLCERDEARAEVKRLTPCCDLLECPSHGFADGG